MFDGLLLDQTDILVPFGDSVSSVTVLPASFLAAVHADWQTAGLDASVGTLWDSKLGRGKSIKDGPYVIQRINNTSMASFPSGGQIDRARITFRCYADTPATTHTMVKLINAWMIPSYIGSTPIGRRFGWDGGFTSPAVRGPRSNDAEKELGPGSIQVYCSTLSYDFDVRGIT